MYKHMYGTYVRDFQSRETRVKTVRFLSSRLGGGFRVLAFPKQGVFTTNKPSWVSYIPNSSCLQ